MKSFVAMLAAVVLAVGTGLVVLTTPVATAAYATGQQVLPEATRKKTPKKKKKSTPKASATATPSPSPSATRTAAEEDGERWVQLAVIGGGGLIACVLAFFGIGALMRRRPR